MFFEVDKAVDEFVAPSVFWALQRVRALKEEKMPRRPRVSKGPDRYECTVCGYKHAVKHYAKIHVSAKHKDDLPQGYAAEDYVKEIAQKTSVEETPMETAPVSEPVGVVVVAEPEDEVAIQADGPVSQAMLLEEVTDVVVCPESPIPLVPSPPPPTPGAHLLSVPVGSVLVLNGPAWWQNPGTKSWEPSEASHLTVQIVGKEIPQDDVMLVCRADGSTALWSVAEHVVLSGQVKLLKLAPVEPSMGPLGFKPEDGPRDFQDPGYDYFGEERAADESRQRELQAKEQFLKDVGEYVAKRDACKEAAAEFERVRDAVRGPVMAYVRAVGTPSEYGRSGLSVQEGGFEVQISETPAPTFIDRDEAKIHEWLAENGYDDCLRLSVDFEKWEELRDDVGDDGQSIVPREFVQEVEKSRTGEATERLLINPLPEINFVSK